MKVQSPPADLVRFVRGLRRHLRRETYCVRAAWRLARA